MPSASKPGSTCCILLKLRKSRPAPIKRVKARAISPMTMAFRLRQWLREALVLARTRWQIELIFKLWKSHGRIDEWRSKKPWRILCEVYAKLTAMVVQHWLLLVSCWHYPDRSLFKAAKTIRKHTTNLVCAFASIQALSDAIETIQRCLSVGCRINKRKALPHTYQLLLSLADGSIKSTCASSRSRTPLQTRQPLPFQATHTWPPYCNGDLGLIPDAKSK